MNILDHFSGGSECEAAVILLAGLWLISRRYRSTWKTRGSAKWLTLWQAHKAGLLSPKGKTHLYRHSLVTGDWKRWLLLPLYYRGDGNVLIVGAPGSMKGAGCLIPNALRSPFLFLYDLGGEITSVCVKSWRDRGYAVHVINFWDLYIEEPYALRSSGFNPCDILDPTRKSFDDDALWLAKTILPGAANGSGASEFFDGKAFGLYHGLIMYNKLTEAPENQNLVQVRRYIRGTMEEWSTLIMRMIACPHKVVCSTGKELSLMMNAPKQFVGILSTMEIATKFLDSEFVKTGISQSGTRFEDLRGTGAQGNKLKGAIISVIIPPEYKDIHAPLARLAIACAIITAQRGEFDSDCPQVTFIIDELNSLKKFDMVVDGLAMCRKYHMWFILAIQAKGQIIDTYGESGWSKVEIGCELRQYLSSWDDMTAKHVSDGCGTSTVEEAGADGKTTSVGRQLAFREEVTQTRRDEQIVFFGSLPPAKMKLRPYWQRPELRGMYSDNPFHGKTPGLQATWRVQWTAGWALRLFAGLKLPLAVTGVLVAAALIGGLQ